MGTFSDGGGGSSSKVRCKCLWWGKRDSSDLLGCPHCLIQDLVIQDGAIFKPDSDTAAQDAFDRPSVECCEDGSGRWAILSLHREE